MKKLQWKKDYGDGYYTEDWVLWIDGNPTTNIAAQGGGNYKVAYVNDEEVALCDTFKEAKQIILEELGF